MKKRVIINGRGGERKRKRKHNVDQKGERAKSKLGSRRCVLLRSLTTLTNSGALRSAQTTKLNPTFTDNDEKLATMLAHHVALFMTNMA